MSETEVKNEKKLFATRHLFEHFEKICKMG